MRKSQSRESLSVSKDHDIEAGQPPPPPQPQPVQVIVLQQHPPPPPPPQEGGGFLIAVYPVYFEDPAIRAAFIRKVFALVTIMLATVAGFCAFPLFHNEFADWCRINWGWQYLAMAIFLVLYFCIFCCSSVRRNFPTNIICLIIFTLAASVMTMFIVANYTAQSVLITMCITTFCSAAVIIFACTTNKDLTSCLGVAFILGMILMAFGLFTMIFHFFFHWPFLIIIYSTFGALLMMFYLAIDIQMLMGGRQVEISPDEHIFAATQIFLDILTLFLMLLNIFGDAR